MLEQSFELRRLKREIKKRDAKIDELQSVVSRVKEFLTGNDEPYGIILARIFNEVEGHA